MFWRVIRIASEAKKASARLILLLAESSSDRSNHCTAAVCWVSATSTIRCRARLQHLFFPPNIHTWRCAENNLFFYLSLRMGFRLYGMALEPTWSFSKGSSNSFWFERRRMSVQILWTDAPRLPRTETKSRSTLRVYVWPVIINDLMRRGRGEGVMDGAL